MEAMLDDIPPSTGSMLLLKKEKKKKKKKKEKKKKKKEVDDWFSYHRPDLELIKPLSVLMIQCVSSTYAAMIYELDGLNAPPKTVGFPNITSKYSLKVLGSWNGLVALYDDHERMACLFNPDIVSSCIWCPIPMQVSFDPQLSGLCYDADNDEYKGLLCDVQNFNKPRMTVTCVLRFKSKSFSWIHQSRLPKLAPSVLPIHIGVIVKGVPYWICSDFRDTLILKFDSKTERLEIVPRPPERKEVAYLGTLDGRLTATIFDNHKMEIWTFIEYNNENDNDWIRMFVLPPPQCYISTLSWMVCGVEVLVQNCCGMLSVYNIMDGRRWPLSSVMLRSIKAAGYQAVVYARTLTTYETSERIELIAMNYEKANATLDQLENREVVVEPKKNEEEGECKEEEEEDLEFTLWD